MSRMEGEGWERVRQSGRLSGVWTCLAACTKQRKYTDTRSFYISQIQSGRFERRSLIPDSCMWLSQIIIVFAEQILG